MMVTSARIGTLPAASHGGQGTVPIESPAQFLFSSLNVLQKDRRWLLLSTIILLLELTSHV